MVVVAVGAWGRERRVQFWLTQGRLLDATCASESDRRGINETRTAQLSEKIC